MTLLAALAAAAALQARASVPLPRADELPPGFAGCEAVRLDESIIGRPKLEAARYLIRAGQYLKAECVAAGAISESRSDPEVYETISWARLKQNRAGPASESASAALRLDPGRAMPYLLLAFSRELEGDRVGLVRNLEAAVKSNPRYKPLLAKARGVQPVFRQAGWQAARESGERFVLRGEGEASDRGTDDTLFLDGVVPGAGLLTWRDILLMVSVLGLVAIMVGILARRAWTTRRTARPLGPTQPRPDLWDEALDWLAGKFAGLEESVTGRTPPIVAGPVSVAPGPPARPPASAEPSGRSGRTPYRSGKTPLKTPRSRGAGKQPVPSAPGAGDPRSKYEQVRLLGRTEDGVLWEGFDRVLQRPVALEELRLAANDPRRPAALARTHELALLRHPAVLDLYDFSDLGDKLWLIFELLEGRTLKDRIAEAGRLGFEETREVLTPVCEALEVAHSRGLLHGHLKPSRVILADAGYVKVSGFEVIRAVERGRRYLAPEAERNAARAESDVFSLGVCLYEMLAGRPPFGDDDLDRKARSDFPKLSQAAADAPPSIDNVIAAALAPRAEARLRSPRQFLDALRAPESVVGPPPPQRPPVGKPAWWRKFKKASRKSH